MSIEKRTIIVNGWSLTFPKGTAAEVNFKNREIEIVRDKKVERTKHHKVLWRPQVDSIKGVSYQHALTNFRQVHEVMRKTGWWDEHRTTKASAPKRKKVFTEAHNYWHESIQQQLQITFPTEIYIEHINEHPDERNVFFSLSVYSHGLCTIAPAPTKNKWDAIHALAQLIVVYHHKRHIMCQFVGYPI